MKIKAKSFFWNVDTQHDFMDKTGALYVDGAEDIKPVLSSITKYIKDEGCAVVSTRDYHLADSVELSDTPNFIDTFPHHCMANTRGSLNIPETLINYDVSVPWDVEMSPIIIRAIKEYSRIEILKDRFDFVTGNQNSEKLLEILKNRFDNVYVYGVAGNVCVHTAVLNLQKYFNVFVFENAIADIPSLPSCVGNWKKSGVTMLEF